MYSRIVTVYKVNANLFAIAIELPLRLTDAMKNMLNARLFNIAHWFLFSLCNVCARVIC